MIRSATRAHPGAPEAHPLLRHLMLTGPLGPLQARLAIAAFGATWRRRRAVLLVALLFGALVVLALLDALTGPGVTLAILYVIPALLGAVLVGMWPGLALALAGTVGWALAELPRPVQPTVAIHTADAVVRFVGVSLAVLLVDALRRTMVAAVESDRRARDFLEMAAHQVRTPVAALRASAEALLGIGASADQEPLLADIAVQAARIGRLLNHLLWVTRLDAGMRYQVRPYQPTAACRDEVDRVARRAVDLQLGLEVDAVPAGEVAEDVLRETLGNLLDNALRHARTEISTTLVWDRPGRVLRLAVRDDGPGVAPGREEEIFGRFVSFDGGTGLGLALCRDAARAMGGDLTYHGGAFELVLPFSQAEAEDQLAGTPTRAVQLQSS